MLKSGDFDEWKRLEEIQSVTMNMQTHSRLQFEQYIIRKLVFFVQKLEKISDRFKNICILSEMILI